MAVDLTIWQGEGSPPAEPSPASGTRRLTAQQQVAQANAERQADIIQDAVFAAGMAGSIPVGNGVGAGGFKIYLDRLLKEAGNPTDPLERMLVEQIALAHQRVAQLHIQAAAASTADEVKQYMSVAIRLTGELRRLALGVKQYRQPAPTKKFMVVKQQNLSTGPQQVAYLEQSAAAPALGAAESAQEKIPSLCGDPKQESSRLTHDQDFAPAAQPQASSRWSQEPEEARAFDA